MMLSPPMSPRTALRIFGTVAGAAFLASLAGCAGFVSTASDVSQPDSVMIGGKVHGGQQPVSGSHIYLYTVGTGGYGSASTSILKAQTGATMDANGNYYVTTDANGGFAFSSASITCTKTASQTYLLALGGNPGLGGTVNNSAISLMLSTGKCGSFTTSSYFNISEISTVALVTTAQQYIVDGTHFGGSGTLPAGIRIAANLAGDLVGVASGVANTANGTGTGVTPNVKVNAIGNALAPCVNASSPSDPACTSLFSAVTPSGGTMPTDVVGAMLLIAKNPGNNAANIYGQATPTAPYQPTVNLSAPPQDLTLAITYSGGGMTAPGNVVIDASGDAFMGNSPSTSGATGTDSIVGFGPDGTILTGAAGFTNGIHAPGGLAFDNAGNLWSNNAANSSNLDQVVKQTSAGALTFAFNDSTLGGLQGIAIDSSNNAWVANQNNNSIVKVNTGGTRTLAPVTSSGFTAPTGVGIDGTGVLFAAGSGSNSILKFNSSGTVTSTAGGYTSPYFAGPIGISIDNADHVWSIQNGSSAIIEINGADGSSLTPPASQSTLSNAFVLAIDGAGGAWYANCRSCSSSTNSGKDNLVHVAAGGAQATGSADGYQDSHLSRVGTAAIDMSGNVWVTNNATGTVTEFLGIAVPVVTPLAVASAGNKLGVKP